MTYECTNNFMKMPLIGGAGYISSVYGIHVKGNHKMSVFPLRFKLEPACAHKHISNPET